MRLKLPSTLANAAAFAAVGLILQLGSRLASAQIPLAGGQTDPESAIRGSLGASLADLDLDRPLGALSFCLNGAFAMLCVAGAILLIRANSRRHRGSRTAATPMHRVRLRTTLGD